MPEITAAIEHPTSGAQLHLRRLHLRVVEGPDAGVEVVCEADVARIGSLPGQDLILTDSTVSRSHAEVVRTSQGVLLRDLGSTNGTFVGPVRVREVFLAQDSRFRVGLTHVELVPADEVVDIEPAESHSYGALVGRSRAMREVYAVLERVARTELTVLVTGETGTGKELASRALHDRSPRSEGPFVVLDCGAVPHNLVDSELFGHERGAFTGAVAPRAGVFEQANGGTLFIDELGELPLDLQPALLRVLETRKVRRVGGRRSRRVDVRVVAATHRDLREAVSAGTFREDLYYRLAVVEVRLPPLRHRREDFELLVAHLLDQAGFAPELRSVTPEVAEVFAAWRWPGNVRELRNVLLRAASFTDTGPIGLSALPEALRRADGAPPTAVSPPSPTPDGPPPTLREAREALLESFERRYLEDLLERTDGNVSRAARIAGVDRKTITRMLRRHGLR